jgi:hypothetical protein
MWGGPYWNQNTRLIYWPMLVSGDLDLMKPYFDLYLNALPFAEAYSETLFHHNGAFYPETFYFWGSYTMDNFGWDTDIQNFKHIKNQYIRYHYQGALETLAMMFDYYSFTTDSKFVQEKILPFASEILTFYENRFPKDENGKMKIFPSQALETYWDISNPTPEIAGLRWNLSKLLSLPEKILSAKIKSKYEKLLSTIPEIPVSNEDGKKLILPCESVPDKVSNSETPELYPVFPYRFFGLNKPDLDRAVNTFYKAKFRGARCWQQTDVVAAYLGITDTAKNLLVHRLDYNHPKARFPIFWGSNMDWCPDEDHGGNLMIALQAMLLQYDEKSITLFPAFPKDWNVDFKLHAPDKTEISCIFEKGKLEKLDVIPKSAKNKIKIKK